VKHVQTFWKIFEVYLTPKLNVQEGRFGGATFFHYVTLKKALVYIESFSFVFCFIFDSPISTMLGYGVS
jgi:hypothetical protein